MGRSNGAGLTLKAALASHRWKKSLGEQPETNDDRKENDGHQRPTVAPPPPPTRGNPQGAGSGITSQHDGSDLDHIRTAILALQLYAESETDDQDLALVHQCILNLQKLLASSAKEKDAALGVTPALKHVRRVTHGAGY